jgi:SNF2 family DNA or RNA helicase
LEEVEDLCNSSQPEEWETEDVVNNRFLWKTDHRSREWFDKKLTKYMDNDDEMLKRAKSRFTKVDTASDENQIRAEFIRSSATSNTNGGVTIRRDEIVHTLNVRKKVKIAPAVGKAKDSQRRANTLLSNPELGTLSQSTQEARSSSLRSTPLKTPAKGNNMQGSSSGQTSTSAKRGPADGSDLDYDIDDDDVPKLKPFVGDTFWDSCTELSTEQDGARTIRIAAALASQLKPHQIEGVKFLWQNSCKDLSTITRKEQVKEESKVGGCILAHMMGLGACMTTF